MSSGRGESKEFRRMVEDIIVSPFFKRHASHMPATLKLHAEVKEDKGHVFLEARVDGFSEDDVKVDATPNTINVGLRLGEGGSDDVFMHNSYWTPSPVDPDGLKVVQRDGLLKVSVPKRLK
ncbi:MAG: Hsp20/alpha crystallin family protein [Candidatus Altiarchaeota archaeon]|nr:Hsp20/alpha crystallin family protein [Candidatus Altiarchaeota archaeon]